MKKMKFNRFAARSVTAGFVVAALMAAQGAFACSVDNWSDRSNDPLPLASGPDGPDGKEAIARYSGLCAMQASDGVVSFVEDTNPGRIDRIRARFYVLADNSSEAVVYRGLTSTDSPIFGVRLNPDSGDVTLTSAGANAVCSGCANPGAWNSIEIDWNAGGGSLDLWVNSDATTTDPADANATFSTSDTVSSVRLGNLEGVSGSMSFDAYESRRTTAIGRLCNCNASGDAEGAVTANDVVIIVNEASGQAATFAQGTPDCNENGVIGAGDVVRTVNLAAGPAQCVL